MYLPALCTIRFSQRELIRIRRAYIPNWTNKKNEVVVQRDGRGIAEIEQLDQQKRAFSVLAVFPFG